MMWLASWLACPAWGAGSIVYLAENGDDQATGASRSEALRTIHQAVAVAKAVVTDGQVTVCVSPGVYTMADPVVIDAPIHVRGEGAQVEDVVFRNTGKASWNSPDHRVFKLNHPQAWVSHAVLENGHTDGPGFGVLISEQGGMVSNCVVRGHIGSSHQTSMPQGAVYLGGDAAILTHSVVSNCVVRECDALWINDDRYRPVGGVGVEKGRVENCLVADCGVAGSNTIYPAITGGIQAKGGSVVNCTVVRCKGSHVGGIKTFSGTRVVNCVSFDNKLLKAVREFIDNPDGSVTTNRFADAVSVSPWTGNGALFENCAGDAAVLSGSQRCRDSVSASDFRDYAHGNLVPAAKGILMNAGVTPSGWAGLIDLAGKPRVKGRSIDIGCYEGNPSGLSIRFR